MLGDMREHAIDTFYATYASFHKEKALKITLFGSLYKSCMNFRHASGYAVFVYSVSGPVKPHHEPPHSAIVWVTLVQIF
jgi:hypothetical protein